MNKKYSLVLLIVAIVIIGVSIKLNSNPYKDQTIKIGATLPLTGGLSFIGNSVNNGLKLAMDEINTEGGINGRKIQIIAEDNQGDSKTAVSSVQKMLNVDNVDLMISDFTPITKAILPMVSAKNIPMVYYATDGSMASKDNLFFRDYFDAAQSASAIFEKVKIDERKNIKVISEQQEACQQFVNTFKDEASKTDIKVTDEVYFQATEKDFRTYITKLNIKKNDALLICAYRHSQLIIKNLSELGLIDTPTYQLVAPFLPIANEPASKTLFSKNKTISTWYGFAEKDNTVKQDEFIKKYTTKFRNSPVPDSAYAYDDVYIIRDILMKCLSNGKIVNSCYKSEMSKVNYDGVAGKVSFDIDGRSNRETILIKAENNQWVTIK